MAFSTTTIGTAPCQGIHVNKLTVLQAIIDKLQARTYLEIGVAGGHNFCPIRIHSKVAVDPAFQIPLARKIKWLVRDPRNLWARYFQCTSDSYFGQIEPGKKFDVVFVDGLHTHEQSLTDVLNALKHLNAGGVVVMHDCNPPSAAAAQPAPSFDQAAGTNMPGWTGRWFGDVWKSVCFLRSQQSDLNVFVLDCDCGLGIVTRGAPENHLALSLDNLREMTYADLARDRERLLNLKSETYFSEFIQRL